MGNQTLCLWSFLKGIFPLCASSHTSHTQTQGAQNYSTVEEEKGKKSLGGNNNGLDTTKGRIGELEENSAKEIIKSEAHTHKKYLKNEYSFNL